MKWVVTIFMLIMSGCVMAKTPGAKLPTQHTVKPGESLGQIAMHYYGKENVAQGIRAILDANPIILQSERKPLRAHVPPITIPELGKP